MYVITNVCFLYFSMTALCVPLPSFRFQTKRNFDTMKLKKYPLRCWVGWRDLHTAGTAFTSDWYINNFIKVYNGFIISWSYFGQKSSSELLRKIPIVHYSKTRTIYKPVRSECWSWRVIHRHYPYLIMFSFAVSSNLRLTISQKSWISSIWVRVNGIRESMSFLATTTLDAWEQPIILR